MSARSDSIAMRGWVALGFAFTAMLAPMLLDGAGIAVFDPNRSADDPGRPADVGLAERICLVIDWMAPACLLAFLAAQFRVRYAVLFAEGANHGLVFPLVIGCSGLGIIALVWLHWGAYTGQHYAFLQGWQFGLGWALFWWGIVFMHLAKLQPNESLQRMPR
jgi:hypothetical protein